MKPKSEYKKIVFKELFLIALAAYGLAQLVLYLKYNIL